MLTPSKDKSNELRDQFPKPATLTWLFPSTPSSDGQTSHTNDLRTDFWMGFPRNQNEFWNSWAQEMTGHPGFSENASWHRHWRSVANHFHVPPTPKVLITPINLPELGLVSVWGWRKVLDPGSQVRVETTRLTYVGQSFLAKSRVKGCKGLIMTTTYHDIHILIIAIRL
jgi:hypothetical protein